MTTSLPIEALALRAAPVDAGQEVHVNRTAPDVAPPPLTPSFSTEPSDAELTRARVFEEPLLPLGSTTVDENRALARAVGAYLAAGGRDAVAPFTAFLSAYPQSPWGASLLANLGIVYRRTGHFSRALDAWNQAWSLAKDLQDRSGRAVADRALGELFGLNARLGRFEVLERLFEEIDGREVRGSATEQISGARQALWAMRNRPEDSFRCGPEALDQLLRFGPTDYVTSEAVRMCPSTQQGTSLAQLKALAAQAGTATRIAHRPSGAEVVLPSLVHWKVGHFAALVGRNGDQILMRDPTFGDELWLSVATLDEEATGYVLIHDRPLPTGWRAVGDDEGHTIWGKGQMSGPDLDDLGCNPDCGGSGGMASVSVHLMLISITVRDTPIWYMPPRGPAVEFTATYNQRDAAQPQTFSYSNLGPKWTLQLLSYIEDDPGNGSAPVKVYRRGAGRETSNGYDAATQTYATSVRSQALIKRTSSSPIRYERQLSDGSLEVFAQPDGAQAFPRKVFMTESRDAQGNALTYTYDAQLRLVAVTDAVGQVTTVAYELPGDPLKITKVTDPFNRTATFAYDGQGRLERVTDLVGLQSSFSYNGGDLMTAMTTPYGTTRLDSGEYGFQRWVEIIDPAGGRERLLYGQYGNTSIAQVPANQVPNGTLMPTDTYRLNERTTLHWDKRAMAVAPESSASATEYSWTQMNLGIGVHVPAAGIHSLKRPHENRVWQNFWGGDRIWEGTIRKPSHIGRVLDDGTTQVTRHEYNSRGNLTKTIDPLGRETVYEYAANGVDAVTVKQKNGAAWDLLETRTYNGQHLPLTVTDASGQTTTYTYNAAGQVLTVTNAKNETTTYAYDTNGRQQSITGPMTGATTTFTYDALSRVRTVTDADNYTLTTDYDAMGRVTRTTYPDGTYEETSYDKLDAVRRRDRLGRITHFFYDAAQRLTATRDPMGRTVTQEWCGCGSLDALVDANGNRTRWERDAQGRVTKEIRADARETLYAYENTTSRLKSVTDAKNQVTTYSYFGDDRMKDTVYTNEQIATPDVSFTYDAAYGRLATMLDGAGTTTYGYHGVTAPPALGATRLASVDGPLPNDTITYSYDQLGRVTTRAINGVGVTWTFDALGRVAAEANSLGGFTYTYDGPTDRVATVSYPNGQATTYSYLPNAQDHRLQVIHHQYPNGATLSKFDYTYNAVGNILTWRQQADTTAVTWEYGYDAADQLAVAVKKATDPQQTVLKRYAYSYDPAGNRAIEQIDDQVTGATYNNANELVSQQAVGEMMFAGTVNEPATVTVAGQPASMSATNEFRGSAPIALGTNTVTITAADPSGNATTKQYQVSNTATSKTFTYDANGNLTSDGTRTFEWDARNQLVAVNVGAHRSEFSYDGRQRRVRIVEKENSIVQSDTKVIWCQTAICEERAADGVSVTRRLFTDGEQVGGVTRFFAGDHLGSVTEVTDASAGLVTRYAFDPWGRRTVTSGVATTSVGFTGHEVNTATGLSLALYRAYDAELGGWISEDPIRWEEGPNFYRYAAGNPVVFVDALGLKITCVTSFQERRVAKTACGTAGCTSVSQLGVKALPCERDQCTNT